MTDDRLRQAVAEYLDALDRSRQQYVPTARNAPDPEAVRTARRQALSRAEERLRAAAVEGAVA